MTPSHSGMSESGSGAQGASPSAPQNDVDPADAAAETQPPESSEAPPSHVLRLASSLRESLQAGTDRLREEWQEQGPHVRAQTDRFSADLRTGAESLADRLREQWRREGQHVRAQTDRLSADLRTGAESLQTNL